MEELRCIGCGSTLQSVDKQKPGFIPQNIIEKGGQITCQRCFRLRHYNEVVPSQVDPESYQEIIEEIGKTNSLVVMLIDLFDLEGSIVPQIAKLTNNNDLYIIANKLDLLPKNVKESKLLHHVKYIVAQNNLKPIEIKLMSAKKNKHLDAIFDDILEKSNNRDIYIVGATNVGKSTFINALLKAFANADSNVITVSETPGTTLNMIEIPLDDQNIYDTPGLLNKEQISHYLSFKSIQAITPKKEIKPRNYQLNPEQTLFFGSLARVDFIKGESTGFVCYFAEGIKIHRTKLENAEEFYNNHKQVLITPPYEGEENIVLTKKTFQINSNLKQDIVFPGLGFITVKGRLTITVFFMNKTNVYIRDAII